MLQREREEGRRIGPERRWAGKEKKMVRWWDLGKEKREGKGEREETGPVSGLGSKQGKGEREEEKIFFEIRKQAHFN